MNILYELDNNFAPQVCASMVSVCENNRHLDEITFYVFGLGLSEQTRAHLVGIGERYGRAVQVIPIDGFMKTFGDFDTLGWTEVVMGRLLVARFLPETLQKILYLDGDTIVRGSLAPLEHFELDDNMVLGAVIEATVNRKRLLPLGIQNEPYFNSGVILFDMNQWRQTGAEDALIAFCMQHKDDIVAPDQDAINGALKGKIQALSPAYNWCNSYVFYPYRVLRKLMGPLTYYARDVFDDAVAHPIIVHYLGEERPWRKGNTHRYRDDYRRYVSMTPYADTPEEEGWELYFRVWRVFNFIMRPFPLTRYRAITALIPKMMVIRKKRRVEH